MHTLTVFSGTFVPITHRAFIQTKGFDDRLDGTAVGQQNDHLHHHLWVAAQPVENGPLGGRKGLLADRAPIPFVFLAMNMNVPFARLSSCRTVPIRTKYRLWVHWLLSWMW